MIIKRGDVYYAMLDPIIGSEQGGFRPVVIIQNDVGNRYSTTVIASVTTRRKKENMPTHVPVKLRHDDFPHESVVMLEQVRTIDKSRLLDYICTLSPAKMREIDRALAVSLGIKYCGKIDKFAKNA